MPGHALVGGGVDLLQQLDRLEVLPSAVAVGLPLALLAGVVEVQHRGDAVDAQAVGVELLQPVDRVGHEEVAHLLAAEVEDVRTPLGVPALARVGVLVERLAVELRQRPGVRGEVAGDPVEDDADAGLVQAVDEVAEVVGVPEPRGRREVPGDVVPPGAAEGVLHHRHQLDVGEPGVQDVTDQLVGDLAVRQPLPPRPEVHLVHAHRARVRVALRAGGHVLVVAPGVACSRPPGRRWRAGRRCPAPSGRTGCATGRRDRGSRSGSACRRRCPGRTAPTPRTRRGSASGAGARPSGWRRRPAGRPGPAVPRPRTRCRAPRPSGRGTGARGRRGRSTAARAGPRRSGAGRSRRAWAGTGTGRRRAWPGGPA